MSFSTHDRGAVHTFPSSAVVWAGTAGDSTTTTASVICNHAQIEQTHDAQADKQTSRQTRAFSASVFSTTLQTQAFHHLATVPSCVGRCQRKIKSPKMRPQKNGVERFNPLFSKAQYLILTNLRDDVKLINVMIRTLIIKPFDSLNGYHVRRKSRRRTCIG